MKFNSGFKGLRTLYIRVKAVQLVRQAQPYAQIFLKEALSLYSFNTWYVKTAT